MKFMVGIRCREVIEKELIESGIMWVEITQGVVELAEALDSCQLARLKEKLSERNFEVLEENESTMMDNILEIIKTLIYKKPEMQISQYSVYLKDKLGLDDSESGQLFSQVFGVTLQQYAAIQQVERIKEMLLYEGRGIGEVVEVLHLKDEGQLTQIFRQITGLSPAYYQYIRNKRLEVRKNADSSETNTLCD